MSWYNEGGPSSDVVVSTRVRFARNLKSYKFPSKMTADEANHLIDEVYNCFIDSNKSFNSDFKLYKMSDISMDEKLTLFEKHLISKDLCRQALPGACIVSNDETISIMLCEEDHFRLQVIYPGLQLEKALEMASKYETLLSGRLDFAQSDTLGYLTSCPTNVGSGLRVSAMLHLPALTMTKNITGIVNSVGKLGLTIRGMYGEGTGAGGCLYQLSNQVTLGISSDEILKKVKDVLEQIVSLEIKARKALLERNEAEIKNRCMRAFGTLKNSYAISSEEMLNLLSDARLGVALGVVDTSYDKISKLLVEGSPAFIITYQKITAPKKRDIKRAEMAKSIL
ncbi:MAG: protein arginine kinase [Bacillota bacterium]|nr:protein arginine kinase [Bacillota bacterium]